MLGSGFRVKAWVLGLGVRGLDHYAKARILSSKPSTPSAKRKPNPNLSVP